MNMTVDNIEQESQNDDRDLNIDPDFCSESIACEFSQAEFKNSVKKIVPLQKIFRTLNLKTKKRKMLKSYRGRDAGSVPFFHEEDNLVFSHVLRLEVLGLKDYIPGNRRLFIDSSKRILKSV